MTVLLKPPRPLHSRPGANPSLAKIELIRDILEKADEPLSRNQILAELKQWRHATSRPSLNAALAHLGRDGNLADTGEGLLWVPTARGKLLDIALHGPSL